MKPRGDGGSLWTSGRHWKLYDKSDEERREADIEEIVVQEIQAKLISAGRAGGGGDWASPPPVKTFDSKLNFQQCR